MARPVINAGWPCCCPSPTGTGSNTGTGFTGTGTGTSAVCCEGTLPVCVRMTIIGPGWGGVVHAIFDPSNPFLAFDTSFYGAGCVYDPNGYGNGIPPACQANGFPTNMIFPAIGPNCIDRLQMICDGSKWYMGVFFGGYTDASSDCLSLTGCGAPSPGQMLSNDVTPGKWPCRVGHMHMPFFFDGSVLTPPGDSFWVVCNG